MKYKFEEIYVKDDRIYIRGWAAPEYKSCKVKLRVRDMQKQDIELKTYPVERFDIEEMIYGTKLFGHYGYVLSFLLGEEQEYYITFYAYEEGKRKESNTIRIKKTQLLQLAKLNQVLHPVKKKRTIAFENGTVAAKGALEYHFYQVILDMPQVTIRGYHMASTLGNTVEVDVTDTAGRKLDCTFAAVNRELMAAISSEETSKGFVIQFSIEEGQSYYLNFTEIDQVTGKAIDKKQLTFNQSKLKMMDSWYRSNVYKAVRYIKKNGTNGLVKKISNKLLRTDQITYQRFYQQHKPSEAELSRQRKTHFAYEPTISVVVPAYKTSAVYLREMIASVREQSYEKWQLCIANGSGEDTALNEILLEMQQQDARICYTILEDNLGIAGNSNAALALATGEFIALLDHDDLLAKDALFECVKAINTASDIDVVYSDEDKVDETGTKHFEPHFKSDMNMDLLCSMNYICHLFVVRRLLVEQFGGFSPEYDGAQDYDFIFKSIEHSRQVYHIPKVLYHWRAHMDSTAERPESKLYAFQAGVRVIEAHYARCKVDAAVEMTPQFGTYRTRYVLKDTPLVSVIIPNKDHTDDLDVCITSLMETTYPNIEIIVVENNSTDPETFAYYERLAVKNDKVQIVHWKKEFNYSAINNFGASFAKGEYLLLLNNDTKVITPDLFEELLGFGMRENTGIVGARLYYPDDTVQHAGVIVGLGGGAGHAFIGLAKEEPGYMGRAVCAQNYSAVTAACLLIRASIFKQIGGFDEELAVAFNDIDLCLRVREAGYLVVYNPAAQLYHFESKSRGSDTASNKMVRFEEELYRLRTRWDKILSDGDPYYNPNLTLDKEDFSLSTIRASK